jgi:hypothetical protein
MALATSSSIGRYEIVRELGHGAMGVVYEAHDPVLDRTVALKVIRPAAEADELEGYEERFLAEARIAAQLQHPGIVVVHDVGRDEATGALFIALELLRGKTLAQLAREGQVEWRRVMQIVAQVARALGFAHARGVVHRDVKPANVIVLPSGEAKVTDFGIAQLESARQRLTSTGEFIGTPLYTAPEQARVENVDGRADIFSLASVAYTLLAGRPPFMAPSIPGIVHRVVYENPEPLSRFVPELPADVERVMARAMAKDPNARYPSAEALAEDAEDVAGGQPPRHARGDDLVVVADAPGTVRFQGAPPAAAMTPPFLPVPEETGDTRTSLPLRRRDALRGEPRPSRGRLVAAAAVVAVLIAMFVWIPNTRTRSDADAAVSTQPLPGTAASAAAAPSSATQAPTPIEAAKLGIDFEHPLRRGRLKIFVDDVQILDQRLSGQETKKAVVFTMHEGTFRDELDVAPGLHEVRIEVAWDDNKRVERIVGNFRSGASRKLEASLGRYKRDLKLEWR